MTPKDSLFERIVLLKAVPFFELLRTEQLRNLAAVLEPVAWMVGDIVFERDEPGDVMYVIVSGKIGISLSRPPCYEDFVVTLGAGDCFGEMGILDHQPRSATACAIETTEAFLLGKEKLHGLLLAYPELGVGMLRAMSRRLREANLTLTKLKQQVGG